MTTTDHTPRAAGVAVADLTEIRVREPGRIAAAWAARRRRPLVGRDGRLLVVAADHPARGALGVRGAGSAIMAMTPNDCFVGSATNRTPRSWRTPQKWRRSGTWNVSPVSRPTSALAFGGVAGCTPRCGSCSRNSAPNEPRFVMVSPSVSR